MNNGMNGHVTVLIQFKLKLFHANSVSHLDDMPGAFCPGIEAAPPQLQLDNLRKKRRWRSQMPEDARMRQRRW